MARSHSRFPALLLLVAALTLSAQTPSPREQLIAAEDARARTNADLTTLRQGLTDRDPKVRQQAVRGIGRLERADLIASLTSALADDSVDVRVEAANAVGQSARGSTGVTDARSRLLQRARVEQDRRALGVVAATLGRLAYAAAADVDEVEAVIAGMLPGTPAGAIQVDGVLGAVEGLEALARQSAKISRLKEQTLGAVRAAARLEARADDVNKVARIRRLATLTLSTAGGITVGDLDAGLVDSDEEVRRLTMLAARAHPDRGQPVLQRGLTDSSPRVRFEALQGWGRQYQKMSCEPVMKALADSSPHVVLLAIDLLGNGCPDVAASISTLQAFTTALNVDSSVPRAWHRAAHAIVALAKVAPDTARSELPKFIAHDTWQVRMYAARAAGTIRAIDDLNRLARDVHHNVREAAIDNLTTLSPSAAVPHALEGLTSTDYQLVMASARALAAAADKPTAITALQKAFDRIAAERKDTSRDARRAIRDALGKLGGPVPPDPQPLPQAPPRFAPGELDALARTRLRFTMAGRGVFELGLLPDQAPVTARHIAMLARQGYYNGLTFHRVAPNFVIQGGSPGANEYAGQGPFMRDEVGLASHLRGTVGISTRGRDTGDAQFFVNLVDSPRLDHTYTVFAEVVSGLDVVDAIVEGDTIVRVDLLTR